jgi:transcriptional regulator NrdR family protein
VNECRSQLDRVQKSRQEEEGALNMKRRRKSHGNLREGAYEAHESSNTHLIFGVGLRPGCHLVNICR